MGVATMHFPGARKRGRDAFTRFEALVVIAAIGIPATLLPSIGPRIEAASNGEKSFLSAALP